MESEAFARHIPDAKPPNGVGQGKFEGVITGLWRRYREKDGEAGGELFHERDCPDCQGAKLKKESLRVTVGGAFIGEVASRAIGESLDWLKELRHRLSPEQSDYMDPVLHDIAVRMKEGVTEEKLVDSAKLDYAHRCRLGNLKHR